MDLLKELLALRESYYDVMSGKHTSYPVFLHDQQGNVWFYTHVDGHGGHYTCGRSEMTIRSAHELLQKHSPYEITIPKNADEWQKLKDESDDGNPSDEDDQPYDDSMPPGPRE